MSAGVCTQAEFAVAQGWHRSTVTRLKQAGRLVMQGNRVDAAASLARIDETGGMRFDVAERHAAQRAQQQPQKTAAEPSAGSGEGDGQGAGPIGQPATDAPMGERRSDAQARKEAALANKAEMEVEQMRGNLIPKDDVDAALRAIGTSLRARIEVQPDQLSPLVTPVGDLDENHAVISESGRGILEAVADDLDCARAALFAARVVAP